MRISFCWLKFLYFARLFLYFANFVNEKTTSTPGFFLQILRGNKNEKPFSQKGCKIMRTA